MPNTLRTPDDAVEEEAHKLFQIAEAIFQHMSARDRRMAVAKLIDDLRSMLRQSERSAGPEP